jgi:hypothetical protein
MTTTKPGPQIGLRGRIARGKSWDILGRLAPSTPCAWSVCLDRWATDASEVGGVGC